MRGRLTDYERKREENAQEFALWKEKSCATVERKKREKEKTVMMITSGERDAAKPRVILRSQMMVMSTTWRRLDHLRTVLLQRMQKREELRNDNALYRRYLVEKSNRPIFTRTMQERLNVDSDGNTMEGIDVDGEPLSDEETDEESSEDDDGSSDSGDGSATSSESDYSDR